MNPFEVKLIATETESMGSTLGISEERHIQLCDAIKEQVVVKKENDITVMLAELSKVCRHANELAYVSFKLADVLSKQQVLRHNPLAILAQMMGGRG